MLVVEQVLMNEMKVAWGGAWMGLHRSVETLSLRFVALMRVCSVCCVLRLQVDISPAHVVNLPLFSWASCFTSYANLFSKQRIDQAEHKTPATNSFLISF